MTASWLLAFVIAPVTVVAIGYVGVLLHERELRKSAEKSNKQR